MGLPRSRLNHRAKVDLSSWPRPRETQTATNFSDSVPISQLMGEVELRRSTTIAAQPQQQARSTWDTSES